VDTAQPPAIEVVAPSAAPAPAAAPVAGPVAPVAAPGAESTEKTAGAKTVDVGATTFLLGGVAASGVIGVSAFVNDSLSRDVFIRISAAAGATPSSELSTTLAAGRFDTCYAFTGNYARGQGLRLGVCGGADVGLIWIGAGTQPGEPSKSQTMPFVDLGPSVELAAEVGPQMTVLLRAGVGINLALDAFVSGSGTLTETSLATQRAEVGFSWKLR
jgi:hypothetical protein